MKKVTILLIYVLFNLSFVFSQTTVLSNQRPATPAFNGWDGTGSNPGPLDVRNDFTSCSTCNIDFYIDNNKFLQLLTTGDLNVVDARRGYQIDSNYVLWHNNNISNIFVGVNAGNSNNINNNTFVGYGAGLNTGNTTNGYGNTFVGHSAGFSNNQGFHNSIFGDSAGYYNLTGIANVYIGNNAGENNDSNYNVMIGRSCGRNNTGGRNCFYGKHAGHDDAGWDNCFYGFHSGENIDLYPSYTSHNTFYGNYTGWRNYEGTYNCVFGDQAAIWLQLGDSNIFIGAHSQPDPAGVDNSVALGAGAQVNISNQIILGNNAQYVGIGLSNDVSGLDGPRSSLEINSDSTTTADGRSTGSGLQFRQLTITSAMNDSTYISPWGKVLTVDSSGIVKLTDGGGIPFGKCDSIPKLNNNVAVDLNHNQIFYKGNNYTTGNDNDVPNSIGLGYDCGSILRGKLSVYQKASVYNDEQTTAGYFQNESEDLGGGGQDKRGIWAVSDGYSSGQKNIAGDFFADSSMGGNIGIRSYAGINPNDLNSSFNSGGQFIADYGYQNYGVEAYVYGNGTWNYGITAYAPAGTCSNGGPCYDAAGYFNGNTYTIAHNYTSSDANLKYNIQPLSDPLTIIKALEPKSYYYKKNDYPYLSLPSEIQQGLIAQDVEHVLPNLVKSFAVPSRPTISDGRDTVGAGQSFKAIDYSGFIPYLIGAIKQQQESIDSLKQ